MKFRDYFPRKRILHAKENFVCEMDVGSFDVYAATEHQHNLHLDICKPVNLQDIIAIILTPPPPYKYFELIVFCFAGSYFQFLAGNSKF